MLPTQGLQGEPYFFRTAAHLNGWSTGEQGSLLMVYDQFTVRLGVGAPVRPRATKLPTAVQVNLPTRHGKHGNKVKSTGGMYNVLGTSRIL